MVGDGFTPSTVTATGVNVAGGNVLTSRGYRVLAVNTAVYSYGTILKITMPNGSTIIGEAADTGYLATNQVDVLVSGQSELQSLIGGKTTGASVEIVN